MSRFPSNGLVAHKGAASETFIRTPGCSRDQLERPATVARNQHGSSGKLHDTSIESRPDQGRGASLGAAEGDSRQT
jgi:hypothetical protein